MTQLIASRTLFHKILCLIKIKGQEVKAKKVTGRTIKNTPQRKERNVSPLLEFENKKIVAFCRAISKEQ